MTRWVQLRQERSKTTQIGEEGEHRDVDIQQEEQGRRLEIENEIRTVHQTQLYMGTAGSQSPTMGIHTAWREHLNNIRRRYFNRSFVSIEFQLYFVSIEFQLSVCFSWILIVRLFQLNFNCPFDSIEFQLFRYYDVYLNMFAPRNGKQRTGTAHPGHILPHLGHTASRLSTKRSADRSKSTASWQWNSRSSSLLLTVDKDDRRRRAGQSTWHRRAFRHSGISGQSGWSVLLDVCEQFTAIDAEAFDRLDQTMQKASISAGCLHHETGLVVELTEDVLLQHNVRQPTIQAAQTEKICSSTIWLLTWSIRRKMSKRDHSTIDRHCSIPVPNDECSSWLDLEDTVVNGISPLAIQTFPGDGDDHRPKVKFPLQTIGD